MTDRYERYLLKLSQELDAYLKEHSCADIKLHSMIMYLIGYISVLEEEIKK